jgi:hypothetical protein
VSPKLQAEGVKPLPVSPFSNDRLKFKHKLDLKESSGPQKLRAVAKNIPQELCENHVIL